MALEFENLSVAYENGRVVLEGFSWRVNEGEFWNIIGPNGAGKSTIFKTLLKRTKILAGAVKINGKDVRKMDVRDIARNVAVLLQTDIVEKSMRVADYVALGRFVHVGPSGRLTRRDKEIVYEALRSTGTVDFKDKMLGALSSGEMQRVRIARVLAQESSYILLDEPTSHLDYEHRFEIMELLERLNEQGRTIITIMHEFDLAYRYGNRTLVLNKGKIVKSGERSTVFREDLFREVFHVHLVLDGDRIYIEPLLE